jgi:hypothetical protein
MLKAALVGAIALATIGSSLAFADSIETNPGQRARLSTQSQLIMTQAQVARFKSVLKLTAAQEQYWPAVELAFQQIIREQFHDETAAPSLAQRIGNRALAMGVSALAVKRLISAAYPLIQTFDEGQKQSALAVARSMGLESVAAAF